MENRSKYLFKNTLIFTIGNLATKIISFFLIPLYTNVLTTSEYGTVDLVVTIATVAIPILTLNVMEAVVRFNLDKDVDHDRITKVGIIVFSGACIVGFLLIPACNLIPTLSDLGIFVYYYCIASAASQIFLCDLRGKELLVQYNFGNVLNTLLIAVFNILFLAVLHLGIQGYLIAYTIANTFVAIYAFVIGKGYHSIRAKIDKYKMYEMLKYSIVLIPNSFMWWIMNSSDHVMVTSMIGVAANGIYAISYKFPTLISTIIGIFNQAWGYSAIKEEDSDDVEEYSNSVFNTLISITMIVGVGMMTFIKPFLKIYISADYFIAWQYTPFLIIGCVFMTFGTFMGTSYTVHKDSKGILFSGMFGAVLNIALNFILIPMTGVYGAAFATCISYISVFVFRGFHTRKYLKYHIFSREFIIGSACLIISGLLMYGNSLLFQLLQIIVLFILLILLKKYWLNPVIKMLKRLK